MSHGRPLHHGWLLWAHGTNCGRIACALGLCSQPARDSLLGWCCQLTRIPVARSTIPVPPIAANLVQDHPFLPLHLPCSLFSMFDALCDAHGVHKVRGKDLLSAIQLDVPAAAVISSSHLTLGQADGPRPGVSLYLSSRWQGARLSNLAHVPTCPTSSQVETAGDCYIGWCGATGHRHILVYSKSCG